jgi:solute carrier family 25 protein 16
MSGTLRSLSKSLEAALSDDRPGTLDQEAVEAIQTYIEHHSPIDGAESAKLHDELSRLYKTYVLSNRAIEPVFVECLVDFAQCLINADNVKEWFSRYVGPAIDSAGQRNALVKAAREFLLAVLIYNTSSDNEKIEAYHRQNSNNYCRWILEIHLNDSDWLPDLKGEGLKAEERRRFAKLNARNILLQYGARQPKEFLSILSEKFVETKYRTEALALLSGYVCSQPAHLFQIQNSPLLDNMYECLLRDLSSTGLSMCATVLAMILPHICDTLVAQLPKLFAIYGRLASWQQMDEKDSEEEENTGSWQVLGHLYNIQDQRAPVITPLFTFLYGLFPANLISFLRQPYEYLDQKGYKRPFNDFWDRHSIQAQSKPILELHVLNPSLLTVSEAQEMTDTRRWQHMGSATDIASQCLSLYNPSNGSKGQPTLPDFRLPFDDIPTLFDGDIPPHSYLYDEDQAKEAPLLSVKVDLLDKPSCVADISPTATANVFSPLQTLDSILSDHERLYGKRDSVEKRESISTIPEELNLDDSTVNTVSAGSTLKRGRSTTLPSPGFPATGTSLVGQSPLLMGQSSTVSLQSVLSPNIEATSTVDSQEQLFTTTIAFYQRELMLLKNELDFVSFIEQHSQYRFRKLREQVAETAITHARVDQLLSQNKMLRAKLEKPEHEAMKYQKSLKTYKSERQAYEATLVQKNKEFRAQISDFKDELATAKEKLDQMEREKKELLDSILGQETQISKLELYSEELRERTKLCDAQERSIAEMKEAVRHYELIKNEADEKCDIYEIDHLLVQVEELRIAREETESEKKNLVSLYETKMLELQQSLRAYEDKIDKPSVAVNEMFKSFKQASEDRYSQLKAAHEDLSQRFINLDAKFRERVTQDEELRARIEQPLLPKRSILGYEINSPSDEEEVIGTSPTRTASTMPSVASTSPALSRPETRIKGRGGVQNTSTSVTSNGATKGRKVRGLRM